MKAVIYARVSSKEQEETGYSLPSQIKLLEDYAARKDFKVVRTFAVPESASGAKERKVFREALEYAKKNNISHLLCEKVDRLTRNLKEAVTANDWIGENGDRRIHFVKQNLMLHTNSSSDEKFRWDIEIVLAKKYIANLSEEVKKGQKEKIAQGWLPTKPPIGYKTVGEKGRKIHVLDESKAPLVKKMFELYTSGTYSLKRLVETMYEEGLRTYGGNKLVKSRIADTLGDPFYYGKIRWKQELYEGKHEPLIAQELFEKVQSLLKSKSTPKYSKHLFLFRGLIRCAECNGTITWEQQKGIIYGHCNHYRDCKQTTWSKEKEVEAQIMPSLKKLELQSPRLTEKIREALKKNHQTEIEYHNATLGELQRRYEQIQNRFDKLYDDKLDGRISADFYERKFQEYAQEKETITSSISKHSQANTKYFELGMNLYEVSQQATEIYANKASEKKQQLLSLVFEELLLNEGKLTAKYSPAFSILAQAVQATNSSKELVFSKSPQEIFEPPKMGFNKTKTGAKTPESVALLPG